MPLLSPLAVFNEMRRRGWSHLMSFEITVAHFREESGMTDQAIRYYVSERLHSIFAVRS